MSPDYFCPNPTMTQTDQRTIRHITNLVVTAPCIRRLALSGHYYCQDTFVMDRNDALIAMPVPIVTVRCEMRTDSVQGFIKPEVKTPGSSSQIVSWQPMIKFYKTAFDALLLYKRKMKISALALLASASAGLVGEAAKRPEVSYFCMRFPGSPNCKTVNQNDGKDFNNKGTGSGDTDDEDLNNEGNNNNKETGIGWWASLLRESAEGLLIVGEG